MSLIDDYQNSVNEIEKIRLDGKAKRAELDELIEEINGDYAASVNVLNGERKKKVGVLEYQKAAISRNGMDEIEEFEIVVDEVKNIVDILRNPNFKIHRISKKDAENGVYHGKKLFFFDEMHDSDSISLRAVIVGRKGKIAELRNKIEYSLFVVGHSEILTKQGGIVHNMYNSIGGTFYLSHESSITPANVGMSLKKSFDINELISFYNEKVKALSNENWRIRCLRDAIDECEENHKKIVDVKAKYDFEDFKPLLKVVCTECGKDGYLNKVKELQQCRHCNRFMHEV